MFEIGYRRQVLQVPDIHSILIIVRTYCSYRIKRFYQIPGAWYVSRHLANKDLPRHRGNPSKDETMTKPTTITAAALACVLTLSSATAVSADEARSNSFWWPDQLDLSPLRDHDSRSNPLGEQFSYVEAFNALDLDAVKSDIDTLLTTSQDWWPADFGNYGPLFIRMSWHAAGTYRTLDGRGGGDGGQMRFDPLNSCRTTATSTRHGAWLWPIKQKYGESLSWGDLMILTGNVALENMGFETYGFAGGRTDEWEPDVVYWGPEVEMLASDRHDEDGELKRPLGATHMGLIYVNPEGPRGKPDPVGSAHNIRVAFGRMAMNDEETVALIAGGHTFGKMHGAHKPGECVGAEPAAAATEDQGLGWKNSCGKGHSEDTVTSGLEGAWTQAPTRWTTLYLQNLLNLEWKESRSPAGAIQWVPTDESMHTSVPDAHVDGKKNPPVMTTADLALKFDPQYKAIAERFLANPDEFQQAFARAWYKLTHRDMGPRARYLGDAIPAEELIWQDPVPAVEDGQISDRQIRALKRDVLESGLTVPELVRTAWASAGSFRASDMRVAPTAPGWRSRPRKTGPSTTRPSSIEFSTSSGKIQSDFNASNRRSNVSLADSSCSAVLRRSRRPRAMPAFPFPCRSLRAAATRPRRRPTSLLSHCSNPRPMRSATTMTAARRIAHPLKCSSTERISSH